MNVTKDGLKDRQLQKKGYLQRVFAEQREHAEASAYRRITENNNIITDFQTDDLMERILDKDNMNNAYKRVYAFYRYKGKCRLRVHPKPISKMRDKIRELTARNNG